MFLIEIAQGERTGTNVDHFALAVEDVDVDELAASGALPVEMGPANLFGARGTGRGVYFRDPDGNRVELRTYPPAEASHDQRHEELAIGGVTSDGERERQSTDS